MVRAINTAKKRTADRNHPFYNQRRRRQKTVNHATYHEPNRIPNNSSQTCVYTPQQEDPVPPCGGLTKYQCLQCVNHPPLCVGEESCFVNWHSDRGLGHIQLNLYHDN